MGNIWWRWTLNYMVTNYNFFYQTTCYHLYRASCSEVVWADPNPKSFRWSWYSGKATDTTHLGEYAIPILPLYILLISMAFSFFVFAFIWRRFCLWHWWHLVADGELKKTSLVYYMVNIWLIPMPDFLLHINTLQITSH